MEEEEVSIICPNCRCRLGLDNAGEPTLLNLNDDLPAGSYRAGRGSLVVEDATPAWRENEYFRNQGNHNLSNALKPLTSFTKLVEGLEPVVEEEPEPIDPKLLEASTKDLNQKGIY